MTWMVSGRRVRNRGELARRALMALPDDQRQPIEMALYEGRSYRQVAADLGIPEPEVRARMRSGLQRVRTDMAAEGAVVIKLARPTAPFGLPPVPPLPVA